MIPAVDIRSAVEASWRAAKAHADAGGDLVLNAASCAGFYLSMANGNAAAAIRLLPREGQFTGRVESILRRIDGESNVFPLRRAR